MLETFLRRLGLPDDVPSHVTDMWELGLGSTDCSVDEICCLSESVWTATFEDEAAVSGGGWLAEAAQGILTAELLCLGS